MPHANPAAIAPAAPTVGTRTAAMASPRSNRRSGAASRWTWPGVLRASVSGSTVSLQLKCAVEIGSPALEPLELAAFRARYACWRDEHDIDDRHLVIARDGGANRAHERSSIVADPCAPRLPDND